MFVCRGLNTIGFDFCKSADTGEITVRKAEAVKPDIVIIDLKLTNIFYGIESMDVFQENEDVPIGVMRDFSMDEIQEKVKNIGHIAMDSKPMDTENIRGVIDSILN
jgi:AmiR/NasT family two-component response regulator